MEEAKNLRIDIVEPIDGHLFGQLSLRLIQDDKNNYWMASGSLEIKALLELGIIKEI